MYANLSLKDNGDLVKLLAWNAARAYIVTSFSRVMSKMEKDATSAKEYLSMEDEHL